MLPTKFNEVELATVFAPLCELDHTSAPNIILAIADFWETPPVEYSLLLTLKTLKWLKLLFLVLLLVEILFTLRAITPPPIIEATAETNVFLTTVVID